MKLIKADDLFEIFRRKFDALDPETQRSEDLIVETVQEYMERLLLRGDIPLHFLQGIQDDLTEEVRDMLRKKTYGHMDLKSYKSSQKPKSRPRST
jgi:tRNA A37 N6-isopentenylltransferase MiaA